MKFTGKEIKGMAISIIPSIIGIVCTVFLANQSGRIGLCERMINQYEEGNNAMKIVDNKTGRMYECGVECIGD